MRYNMIVLAVSVMFASGSIQAAQVDYQPPLLSIQADNESLDSVLQSIGKEMDIKVVSHIDLSEKVSCKVDKLPIRQAFSNLLGRKNYALEWNDGGERLTGLTIVNEGDGTKKGGWAKNSSLHQPAVQTKKQPVKSSAHVEKKSVVVANELDAEEARLEAQMDAEDAVDDAIMKERIKEDMKRMEARMKEDREKMEARMKEDREKMEARMKEEQEKMDNGVRR